MLLVAQLTALMMSMPVAMAHHDVGHLNSGNKANDGLDANNGGGQEKAKNPRPPHGGGDQHGGGSV